MKAKTGDKTGIPERHFEFTAFKMPGWSIHAAAWLILFVVLVLINPKDRGFWFAVSNEGIKVTLYSLLVYTNSLYLVPQLLKKQKFVLYTLGVILLVIAVTQLMMIVFYLKFEGMPIRQMLLKQDRIYLYILHFLVVIFSTVLSISTHWYRQQQARIELENKNMSTELQLLKSQINPHFLFNTLNNLYALTLKKSDRAPEVVFKLSELMRYMLYEANESKVPLEREIAFIRNYLALENIRQDGSSEIKLRIEGDPKPHQIAPLLLIPFIENAVKHGLNTAKEAYITITLNIAQDKLRFYIKNTTTHNVSGQNAQTGGIGLSNVKKRLALLYPKAHMIRIKRSELSFEVDLTLKLNP